MTLANPDAAVAAAGFDQVLVAMQAVMEEVRHVPKRGWNGHFKYHYVLASDLLAALQPACIKHGLVIVPDLEGEPVVDVHGNTMIVMNYRIAHVSGQVWPFPVRIPAAGGDKSRDRQGNLVVGDKGVYKALTGAQKYMLQEVFMIPTGDDVDSGTDHDHPEEEQDHAPQRGGGRRGQSSGQQDRGKGSHASDKSAGGADRVLTLDEVDQVRKAAAAKGIDTDDKLNPFLRKLFNAPDMTIWHLKASHRDRLLNKVLPHMKPPKDAVGAGDEDAPI